MHNKPSNIPVMAVLRKKEMQFAFAPHELCSKMCLCMITFYIVYVLTNLKSSLLNIKHLRHIE